MGNESGPYLVAALLCEKILVEKDEVLSVIRMIDRITQTATGSETPETMPPLALQLTALISFKSGDARGPMKVALRPEDPSGAQLGMFSQTAHFEGEDRGVNLIINLNFVAELTGLYWWDVLLDGERITRMPLRVQYAPTQLV
jgi:hypothetical protein